MDWLSQNWLWVAIGVGFAYYLFRSRLGGHGAGHGGMIGMGHGGLAGRGGGDKDLASSRVVPNAPEAAVDPVGGEAVHAAQALTSVYQEKIYYFASKENRDRFEAAPQDFARSATGYPLVSGGAGGHRSHRRHGC